MPHCNNMSVKAVRHKLKAAIFAAKIEEIRAPNC